MSVWSIDLSVKWYFFRAHCFRVIIVLNRETTLFYVLTQMQVLLWNEEACVIYYLLLIYGVRILPTLSGNVFKLRLNMRAPTTSLLVRFDLKPLVSKVITSPFVVSNNSVRLAISLFRLCCAEISRCRVHF
jgi:hypothetical protein